MTLPPEKLSELKQVIHSHLNTVDVHNQIKDVLSQTLPDQETDEDNRQQNLLQLIKVNGFMGINWLINLEKCFRGYNHFVNSLIEFNPRYKEEDNFLSGPHRKLQGGGVLFNKKT